LYPRIRGAAAKEKKMNIKSNTKTIVGLGLLTAIVVVLQAFALGVKFGIFTVSLVLAPIIIGAALYGWIAGAWLGLVFSIVVLLTDAGAFLAVNIPGTIITVVCKGVAAGIAAGLVYSAVSKKNRTLAVILSGIVAPVVNTGIFVIGCIVFFLDTIRGWGEASGYDNAIAYIFVGMIGINFFIELVINLALSATIVQIIGIAKKSDI